MNTLTKLSISGALSALFIVSGSAVAATAAPSDALDANTAPPLGQEKRETTKDYDCVTWLARDGSDYRVSTRCDRIEKNVSVRGVLDISWAGDKHTAIIGSGNVGETVRSSSYSNLNKIRETRIEKMPEPEPGGSIGY